jgi:hypothetical protein
MIKAFVQAAVWGCALSCRRMTPLVSSLRRLFWINLQSLFSRNTHNIITVYTTQSTMNLGCALSFCMKKMNHSKYFTDGKSGDDSVHVSSVITPTLHSKNVRGLAFRDNKRYLLLLNERFGAMTMRFFLPTNRRLTLELPTCFLLVQRNYSPI